MPSYDYRLFAEFPWLDRYPDWANGLEAWRAQRLELIEPQLSMPARREAPEFGAASRPCVFVSHRSSDLAKAARISWLADQEGLDFWLDAFDPSLQQLGSFVGPFAAQPAYVALATATIIEMALLNSTHLIAVLTPNTRGSQWVPYEYGRVKEPSPITIQAGCWISAKLATTVLPEYLHLGVKTYNEANIRNWFQSAFRSWTAGFGSPARAPAGNWRGPVPPPL
jgi:hypothetical protein